MIRKAIDTDIVDVAIMLSRATLEESGALASTDPKVYISLVVEFLNNNKIVIYVDSELRGMFIVEDISSPLTPSLKTYNSSNAYIIPEFRHSKLLHDMYEKLFEDYPTGTLMCNAKVSNPHIDVLDKRHNHVLNVYELNRS